MEGGGGRDRDGDGDVEVGRGMGMALWEVTSSGLEDQGLRGEGRGGRDSFGYEYGGR